MNSLKRNLIPDGLSFTETYKHICRLTVLWTFAFSAVIRASFHYRDDIGRAAEGYYRWSYASRYLSDLFTFVLNSGKSAWDLSPMTQILAIFLTAVTCSFLMELFKTDKQSSFWGYVSVTLMGLNPYWLACLSFQYDSPFMALSFLSSVFPVLFWNNQSVVFSGMAIVGTLIMCMTYQASSGLFPMLVILYALRRWSQKTNTPSEIAKKVFIAAFSYMFAMILYRTFLVSRVPKYVSASMVPLTSLFQQIKQGYLEYYWNVRQDWPFRWQVLALVIIGMFALTQTLGSRQKKTFTLCLSVLISGMSTLFTYGVYLVLEVQAFPPRAMYGVGMMLAVMALCICSSAGFRNLPGKVAILLLGWCFFSFTFLYGNSLTEQKDFSEYRLMALVQDLNDLEQLQNKETVRIQFFGDSVLSPVVKRRSEDYHILKRLVPPTLGEYRWAQQYMAKYTGFAHLKLVQGRKLSKMDLPLIKKTAFYSIYGNEDCLRVEFVNE